MVDPKIFDPPRETLEEAFELLEDFRLAEKEFLSSTTPRFIEDQIEGYTVLRLLIEDELPRKLRTRSMTALEKGKNAYDQIYVAGFQALANKRVRYKFPWVEDPSKLPERFEDEKTPEKLRTVVQAIKPWPPQRGQRSSTPFLKRMASLANRKHDYNLIVSPDVVFFKGFSAEGVGFVEELTCGPGLYGGVRGELARWKGGEVRYTLPSETRICVSIDASGMPRGIPAGRLIFDFIEMAAKLLWVTRRQAGLTD